AGAQHLQTRVITTSRYSSLSSMNTTSKKRVTKLILEPNAERTDERQPGFLGAGSPELGLADYTSGLYLSEGDYGPYASIRFYLKKESEGSGMPKQIKILESKNKNRRAGTDDPHYSGKTEILDTRYKVKIWIRQNPASSLLYIEVVFEEAEHV